MIPRSALLTAAVVFSACSPKDLPSHDLGTQSRLLFRDFDTDPDALVDIVTAMDDLLGDLDLEARTKKRAFALPRLTEEFRADVTVPEGIDDSTQFSVGVAALSRHDVDGNLEAQVQEDQVCINANSVKCHRREALTDVECFLDQSCDTLETFNTIYIKTLPAKFWIEAYVDFRWVELDDGRRAVASRSWMEDSFRSVKEKSTWDQRFGVDLFIPDPGDDSQTRRWYGTWLGGDVGGVGEGWTERILRSGLDQGFENPDDWLDGKECRVDTSDCEWPN